MTRPNILLIMTDQHNPRIAGYAGDEVVDTANLDRLAARSVQFDAAICASPCCTPSRMSMLCGKDVHHCSAWNNHWVIFPEHVTWPRHFADHGYRTSLVGKMHFGGRDQMQGFQCRPYGDLRHGLGHQPDPIDLFPAYHGPTKVGATEIPESLLQDNVVTRESIAWVLEHRDAQPDMPWFCCASYSRPHSPYTAPGRYLRRYRDKVQPIDLPPDFKQRLDPYSRHHYSCEPGRDLSAEESLRAREAYYACVDFVDDAIGDLIDALDVAGALENTIVIYTSDHGDMIGRHGLWGKCVPHDESIGVPLLITGPNVRAGHHRVSDPISLIDLFPTTCAMAGIDIPADLDGVDHSSVLRDPANASPPRQYATSTYMTYAVKAKGAWTVSEDTPAAAMRAVRERDWKYVAIDRGEPLLFDLRNDPDETNNLAADPQHAARCERMHRAAMDGFDWAQVRKHLARDRERVKQFASGVKPTTPNQYMLADGRQFDAETSLYDARWLTIPPVRGGGIIPQQFG
jgi:choline-sulfatase